MARRMTSPVLVGRGETVEQLQAVYDSARAGDPRHAIIGGEAGVGKTRLLAELRKALEQQGAKVVVGGCVSMGTEGLPFAPYTEIIRSLVAGDGVAQVAAMSGRAAPDLARLVPALHTGETAPGQELWAQTRLYEALLDLFRRLAERRPLVLQLEDMHWADAGTLAATSHLLRAIHDEPISIVGTFRSDELTRKHPLRAWLAEVVRDAQMERVELEPLDEAGVASLIEYIVGERMDLREAEEIYRRSDGNPFFVEELLCCRTDVNETLPASLRDVLLSRIDALPDAARHLMGVAAVGGREVEHDILISVAAADDDETATDLRQLVETGLLVPVRAVDGDDAYSFRHALLHEVVYDTMLPTERRRLHRRWGDYLGDHSGADGGAAALVQLAHHWREARDPRALSASIAAGDGAMESYSYETASREYEQALLLWEEDADVGIDHVELLARSARSAYLSSEFRRAAAVSREAIEELGEADSARLTGLLIQLARVLWVSGDWGTSIETYERALDISPAEPATVRIRALAGLAQVYMLHMRLREARPLCEAAIEAARNVGARDLEGHGLNTLAVVLAGLGETRAANETIAAALQIALELGIPDDIGRAYVNRPEIENASGYPEKAMATSLEGMRVSAEWGVASSYGAYIGFGAVNFGFEAGRWDEALEILARADRMFGPDEGGYLYRASYILELMACRGDDRFEPLWERTHRLILERPPSDNHGPIFMGGIEHAAFGGRHDEALQLGLEGIDLIEGGDAGLRLVELARVTAWPAAEVGRAARLAGDAEALRRAREDMDRLAGIVAGRHHELSTPPGRLTEVLVLDAKHVEAERARMEGADTAGQWAELADGWASVGRPFRSALARWRAAETAESAGEREAAVTALREAHAVATELGAGPLLGHLEQTGRRLRVRLGGSTGTTTKAPGAAYGLTRRELEVLREVAAGHTNREIAEILFISESTAGVHVSNILGKLGVSTRTEAARVALDQGLAGPSG